MRTSELKSEIKDYIYEILSEETLGETIVYSEDTLSKDKKDKLKEAIKKIKMMKEGDDKKQKVAALKNIVGKLKK